MIFIKVIFLDFDGVLNGYNRKINFIFKIARKFHFIKFLNSIYDVFGIRTFKVFLLKLICIFTNCKVVLSSSWRNAYYIPYKKNGTRGKELIRKFKFFHIPVIGKTPKAINGKRELEIKEYLEKHKDIKNFIILDDESFDIKEYYPNNLILTSDDENLIGTCLDNSGLRLKHVFKAIHILRSDIQYGDKTYISK